MTCCLANHLSSEVIGQIVSDYDLSGSTVLKLWRCGSRLLNQKLSQGCTRMVLKDLRVTQPSENHARVPKMVYQLPHLRQLIIICPARLLAGFDFRHRFEQLQTLKLKCRNLSNIVFHTVFKTVYPSLNRLTLCSSMLYSNVYQANWSDTGYDRDLPNYLADLPSSLTKLKTSQIINSPVITHPTNAVLNPIQDLFRQLPSELRHFEYINTLSNDPLYDGRQWTDTTRCFPPNLEHLNKVVKFDVTPGDCKTIEALPPTLRQLSIWTEKPALVQNLSTTRFSPLLKHLTFCVAAQLSNQSISTAWQVISALPMLESLDVNITLSYLDGRVMHPEEWTKLLPPKLKHLTCRQRLPIFWIKDANARLPDTLESLKLDSIDQTVTRSLVASATRLKTLQFCKFNDYAWEPVQYIPYDGYRYRDVERLPDQSLETLEMQVVQSACCFYAFKRLITLSLTITNNHQRAWVEFPPSLRHLTVDQVEVFEATPLLAKIVSELPPLLESFVAHLVQADWELDMVQALPYGLKTLKTSVSLTSDWRLQIKALPPNLQSLNLTVNMPSKVTRESELLMSLLPSSIRDLTITSYYFTTNALKQCNAQQQCNLQRLTMSPNLYNVKLADACECFPNLEYVKLY